MNRRRRTSNPLTIIILLLLIGGGIYINQVVVPQTPPLFMPTPTPTRSPESYLAEAEQFMREGKFKQAIQVYQTALLVNPDNPAIYLAIARLQVYTNQYKAAVDNAGNALVINPNNAAALALRGYAQGLSGNYLDAESSLNQAIELDPNNAVPYAYLAEVLALKSQSSVGDPEALNRAIELSRKAQSMAPNALETHRARGLVLEFTTNYEEAVAEFEAAIAQNPYIADLYIYLGRNYRALGDYPKAIRAFTSASTLNPTDPLPLTYLSRTYFIQGEFASAIQYAEKAIENNPTDPYLYGNLGVMHYRRGDYPRAIQALRLAVQGGTTEDGKVVEGLPLSYWPVSEYYYIYGLALARQAQCGEALLIARAVMETVAIEQVSVANAQEIINVCQQVAEGSLPTPSPTPEP